MEGLKNAIKEAIRSSNELATMIETLQTLKLNNELLLTHAAITQLERMIKLHSSKIEYIEELKSVLAEFERINS